MKGATMNIKERIESEMKTINNCLFCNKVGAMDDKRTLENIEARLTLLLYYVEAELAEANDNERI